MKRILGIILSVLFIAIFLGVLVYMSSLKVVLIAIGATIIIIGAIFLCTYLLTE